MKKTRTLALAAFSAIALTFVGCDSTDSSSPEISSFETANFDETTATWTSGGELEFYGKVTDDNSVASLKIAIVSTAGDTVYSTTKNTSGTSVSFGADESVVLTLTNPGTWTAGTYYAVLIATDNDGLTATKSITLTVAGTTTPTETKLSSTSLTLGSNDNATYGSSLEADDMTVYKISGVTTTTIQGDIDAYYAYSSTSATDKFFSPSQAKTSGFDGIKSWTVSTSVALYDFGTMTAAAFDSLDTESEVKALFTGATSAVSVEATEGKVVGIYTSQGAYRIIRVSAITAGSTGTVTVKGFYE